MRPGDLHAWRRLTTPPRIGPAGAGTLALRDLGSRVGCETVMAAAHREGAARNAAKLAPVHLASWVLSELVVLPPLVDRCGLDVEDAELGVDEHDGGPTSLWLSTSASVVTPPAPRDLGFAVARLLGPVAEAVQDLTGVHRSLVRTIAAESAVAGLFRSARSAGRPDESAWLELAASGVVDGLGARVGADRLVCHPDEGPAVVVPDRRLCCVLNAQVSWHSCPGCPRLGGPAARTRDVTRFLAGHGDEDFVEATGRARVGRALGRRV